MLSRLLGDVILRPDARGLWRSFGAIWACCLRMFLQYGAGRGISSLPTIGGVLEVA